MVVILNILTISSLSLAAWLLKTMTNHARLSVSAVNHPCGDVMAWQDNEMKCIPKGV
jgi:hypothetical protein